MGRITSRMKQITLAASVIAFLIIVIELYIFANGFLVAYENEIFLAGILIVFVPSAILDFEHQRWLSSIEAQMPLLVRGVAESQETGMTLIKSLEKVTDNQMIRGPLAKEVKQMVIQMAWGTSFEDALTNFKNNVKSPIVNRFCVLVLEASHSGGTIKTVFTATSGFMEEMNEIDRDSSAQMKTYTVVIYAAFAVFLVTALLLVRSFFAPVAGSQQIGTNTAIGGVSGFKDFFYKDMMVSGITGGLMAGKIGERRITSGLKHAILLVVIGYAIFFFTIPPNWM